MKTNYNATTLMAAENQIRDLIERFHLNPIVLERFKQGTIYYSYITGGILGSVDTVSYDPRYKKAIKEFENTYTGCLVYHAIESRTVFGTLLSLLYVKDNGRSSQRRVTKDGYVTAYVVNLDFPDWSEPGEIQISSYGNFGSLIRIA